MSLACVDQVLQHGVCAQSPAPQGQFQQPGAAPTCRQRPSQTRVLVQQQHLEACHTLRHRQRSSKVCARHIHAHHIKAVFTALHASPRLTGNAGIGALPTGQPARGVRQACLPGRKYLLVPEGSGAVAGGLAGGWRRQWRACAALLVCKPNNAVVIISDDMAV